MTALIVIGCIILFLGLLLFSPLILVFSYKGERLGAKARYLFLAVDFSPEKLAERAEKRAEKAVEEEYKKQKAEEEAPQKKPKAALDTVKTIWSLLKASRKALDTIRRHLIFYKIKSDVIVGGGDAAKIARDYALYCTIAANGLSVLDSLFVVKEPDISIQPDFLREKTYLELSLRIKIKPWFLIVAGAEVFLKFLKVMNENKQKRERVKGGNSNERNKRNKRRKHAAHHQ